MTVVANAINPCSLFVAVGSGIACTDLPGTLDTSPLHRTEMPWRSRQPEILNASPLHRTGMSWRPRQSGENDAVSLLRDSTPCSKLVDVACASTKSGAGSTSSGPWRSLRCLESADVTCTDALELVSPSSFSSTCSGLSRTASRSSVSASSDSNSCSSASSCLRSCLKRPSRTTQDRRVCVNYLDEPGRVEIHAVERIDYSSVGENWSTIAFKRRRCETLMRQFREQRRRGNGGQQQGSWQQPCEAVVFFDYQLALDVKKLKVRPERTHTPLRIQVPQQR